MNLESQKKSSQRMVEAIFALNLDLIKQSLMDKSAGHGWTRRQADQNEREYKRFLVLLAKYPDEAIAPSTEVNKFWRGHILDTTKYAKDCDAVFGYFLHHFPYFGTQDEQDAANLVGAFMNMQRLYEREFGDARHAASSADEAGWLVASTAGEREAPIPHAGWRATNSGVADAAYRNKAAWHAARAGAALPALNKNAAWHAATRGGLGMGTSAIASRPAITGNERAA